MKSTRADIVIIGGGVMGVSIAHHLASSGAGSVLLLEKRYIGAGSSGKSGAIIRQHYSTKLLVEMARTGVASFSEFNSVSTKGSGWIGSGCLVVADSRDRKAAEGNVKLMRETGAEADVLTGASLQKLVPQAYFGDSEIGAWEPEAGCVDPAMVLHGYAASAERLGARIQSGVEVTDVAIEGGRVIGVSARGGRIETRTVVLCAGPWARRLASRAGLELPLTVVRPQVAFFRRPADFGTPLHPVIADLSGAFYCRPDIGERTLVGALDISGDEVIDDPDDYNESASSEFIGWTRQAISARIPAMERAFTRGGYSGLYTVTPDSHPILGEAPAVSGLYLAVGFSGHGFKLSPAVGRGITELIVNGSYQTLDLTPLRATRYAEGKAIASAYEYGLLS